ncbi:hypothetical protein [Clostridium sp.]|uniref:hypothetical protein n=1 Tax=Clostridium sp. TaxID=1506 RepID=UPI001A624E09|nr:hypothetical protein [Clostridium sp.]MBK5243013.1 hypothetical protein [Clostridium sp.]
MEQLENLMTRYKVEAVGYGYIDCIVMKDKLDEFEKEVSTLGVLIIQPVGGVMLIKINQLILGAHMEWGDQFLYIMKVGLVNYRMITMNWMRKL